MIENKVNKIKFQTFVSKDLVSNKTPSVLLDTTLSPLERIVNESSNTTADGSATK